MNIIHRKELSEASDVDGVRNELISEYKTKFGDPYVAKHPDG